MTTFKKTDMSNIEHKVILGTVNCLFGGVDCTSTALSLQRTESWATGNPRSQWLKEMMLSNYKVLVRCYGLHILACTKAKYSKKMLFLAEAQNFTHTPNPTCWQTGRTFHNFYCFTSINVAKLDVTSSVTVFSIKLSNLQIKSHVSCLTKKTL